MKDKLFIIHKYDNFFNYVYMPLLNAPRRHKIFRDRLLSLMVDQYGLLNDAVKINQVSKLYLADSGIGKIRSLLNLCPHKDNKRKILSLNKVEHAQKLLSEVGKILGTIIMSRKK